MRRNLGSWMLDAGDHRRGIQDPTSMIQDRQSAVVVIGGINADIVATADPLRPGVSNPGHIRIGPGGAGRNVAENLARLGVRTRLIAAAGTDPTTEAVLKATRQAGVELTGVVRIADRHNRYVAVASPGTVPWAVSDMSAAESLSPEHIHRHADQIRAAEFVVVDANLAPETIAAAVAAAGGCRLCLLPVSAAKATRIAPHQHAAALLVLGAAEAEVLTAISVRDHRAAVRAATLLRGSGEATVVVTLGSGGLVWAGREVVHLSAPQIAVVDPSGAGDAVAAAATYGLLTGLPDQTAAHLALAAGTMTVTVDGSTNPGLTLRALYAHAKMAIGR